MRALRVLVAIVASSSLPAVMLACGARTGLGVLPRWDAGPPAAHREAGVDVVEEPDAELPPLDAAKLDASRIGCPALTYVYAVATNDDLLRFDPPTATFTKIGRLVCPAGSAHPFSMAVDRKGVAYVEYDNGMLFAVDTSDASCSETTYVPNELAPFNDFGMGYATVGAGPDEQLFIAAGAPGVLGILDAPGGYQINPVGTLVPDLNAAELTGTGDGRLYAFWAWGGTSGSYIAEIDKDTAAVIGQDSLPDVNRGIGWAFAFWGGDFWLFTTPGPEPQTTVKYDPATKQATVVAHYKASIVGAGVSTCAPN